MDMQTFIYFYTLDYSPLSTLNFIGGESDHVFKSVFRTLTINTFFFLK